MKEVLPPSRQNGGIGEGRNNGEIVSPLRQTRA
jgi:hypothetical protein